MTGSADFSAYAPFIVHARRPLLTHLLAKYGIRTQEKPFIHYNTTTLSVPLHFPRHLLRRCSPQAAQRNVSVFSTSTEIAAVHHLRTGHPPPCQQAPRLVKARTPARSSPLYGHQTTPTSSSQPPTTKRYAGGTSAAERQSQVTQSRAPSVPARSTPQLRVPRPRPPPPATAS